ncbi:MAG: hypothetical protein JRH16_16675 [Deltaproteobacteria bacterium]|nr:hypothetical protein [Deltaproteobacteria bacterium]MBW2417408.1 hypothetical protein [Deltaproteobacteria bacterium]
MALAIIGFAGVVLAFGGRGGGPWNELDRVRFRRLFSGTLAPLGLVALALILDALGVERSGTWRICSFTTVLITAANTFFNHRAAARATSGDPERQAAPFSSVWGGGKVALLGTLLVMLLQLANTASIQSFWPFLLSVWWSIALGSSEFVRLLLPQRAAP